MIVDGIRLIHGWMADPVDGVNAQLPNVPREADEPPPAFVDLFNEIDEEWVARGQIPRDKYVDENGDPRPLLIVRMHPDEQGFRVQVLTEYEQQDPNVLVFVVMFVRRKVEKKDTTITLASQVRDARQTIRTAMRVIAQKFDSTHTAHVRGECQFMLTPAGLVLNSDFVEVTDDLVADTLVVPLRVVDRWALGLS